MNFVEAMALHRAFSVGRFRCSGSAPKLVSDFPGVGYSLVIPKDSVRSFCLGCIRYSLVARGFRVVEGEKYLAIQNSYARLGDPVLVPVDCEAGLQVENLK